MTPASTIELAGLPGLSLQGLMDLVLQFMVMSLRVGAFAISAPFFGSRLIALPTRIIFACGITVFVMGRIPAPPVTELATLLLLPIIAQELAIGLAAGLVLNIFFGSVSIAGEKIASTAGLSFAAQVDPNSGGQTPVLSQIFSLFLTAVFLSLNGHLFALGLMLESYHFLPVGAGVSYAGLLAAGGGAAGDMFATAARLMLPLVSVLFLVNVTIGLITRSAPQLNLFSFGFPITLITVFVLLFLAAGPIGFAFQDVVTQALDLLDETLQGGAGNGQ